MSDLSRSKPSARTQVIGRKLRPPPLGEQLVARPRVDGAIAELINLHRVVIVAATAGAGKTTAVARASRDSGWPLAWLTLDATDQAPGRFLTYLEAAIATQLPELSGTAMNALTAQIPHAEAAGLLVDAVDDEPLILVIDALERLGESEESLAVLEALVRYAPPSMRIVLVSRHEPPPRIAAAALGQTQVIGDTQLAFTVDEAAASLALLGRTEVDAAQAVAATGGWITGVLFDAWDDLRTPRARGDADPLNGYLSAQILDQLDAGTRAFLIASSLLDEVSSDRAERLGLERASVLLARLRRAHLPVTWEASTAAMRPHPRFREYLLGRLDEWDSASVAELRRAHGLLLEAEGHDEEATEELLRAGAFDDALRSAQRVLLSIIDRRDFAIAQRWLDMLADQRVGRPPEFEVAELMLAIADDDYRRGLTLADSLHAAGTRAQLCSSTPEAAALMAWCYFHAGRVDDLREVLALAPPGPTVAAVRYATSLLFDERSDALPPATTGSPLDVLATRARYQFGVLVGTDEEPETDWAHAAIEPWRIAVLRATGHTQQALELYTEAADAAPDLAALHVYIGPEVLIDSGQTERARQALHNGAAIARASGSVLYAMLNRLAEIELEVRVERNLERARKLIAAIEDEPPMTTFGYLRERLDTWRGLLALHTGADAEALTRLRAAVASMIRGDRILLLPSAAIYLAEAEWRTSNESAADAAADTAREAASRQGSQHGLLQAAGDFPAVISRRIDAEPRADSFWHQLGRALRAQDRRVEMFIPVQIEFREFGTPSIVVDGAELTRPVTKSFELLAFLCAQPDGSAARPAIFDALFDGRSSDASAAYLRKAISQLRLALPEGVALTSDEGRLSIPAELARSAESRRFETMLGEAARLDGRERVTATLAALTLYQRGPFLASARSAWVERRRLELSERAADAQHDAAESALEAGMYAEAERLAEEVLQQDPYREPTWRLLMRITATRGDENALVTTYRHCESSLATIETQPAPATRQLLDQLRR